MTPEILKLEAAVGLGSGKSKALKLNILASSGGVAYVGGWGWMILNLTGLDISRPIPIADGHRYDLANILGAGHAAVANGELHLTATITESKAGIVRELVSSGIELQASVGILPTKTSELLPGATIEANGRTHEITAPTIFVETGELVEVSILSVGADRQTKVSIAAAAARTEKESEDMTPKEIESLRARFNALACEVKNDPRVMASFAHAVAGSGSEREFDYVCQAYAPRPIRDDAGDDRSTPPINSHLRASNGAGNANPREVLACAFMCHAGAEAVATKAFSPGVLQAARSLGVRHSMDLAKASCQLNPTLQGVVPEDRSELLLASFGPSTYSLPSALALGAEKMLADSYGDTPASWRTWAGKKSVASFRTHTSVRPYFSSGNFEQVPAGGELQHATGNEETYELKADTYGRLFSIDRRDLINDDLGALGELFNEIGRRASLKVADLLYSRLLDNPADFFGTGNGNLETGSGSELSIEALGLAVATLRKQKDAGGRPIALAPRVLLVPPELEAVAASIINSTTMSRDSTLDQASTGNPWAGKLTVEVEPRLSDTGFHANASATHWFVLSGPSTPCAVTAFLHGVERPTVERVDAPAEKLGIALRAYLDFGVALSDFRAGVMMAGE